MYGYIYLTRNLINNKQYIGKHKASHLDRRYLGSGKLLTYAIKKYGKENFVCTILECCESLEELNIAEKSWIEKFDASASVEFYNILKGGDGGAPYKHEVSQATRDKISKAQKGVKDGPLPLETRLKISKTLKGRKRPPEVVEKIRLGNTGKRASDETRKKLSEIQKNRSPEYKAEISKKMSDSLKKNAVERIAKKLKTMQERYPEGLTQSEESNKKRSEALKGKPKSEETKQRMRKPKSDLHRKHMQEAHQRRKLTRLSSNLT